ncbi:MAG: SDR family oxidoreductase [Acetobacteraceae bacterium]|nr:SDR family oxidoreductase [Acetobacteraceae bacterium]
MFRLDGRRALVTGGSKGIGLAASRALAEAGAAVTITGRGEGELAASGFPYWAVDATDTAAMRARIAAAAPFDILVANAGTNIAQPTLEVTEEAWDTIFALNVRAAFFTAQAVAQRLVDQARPGVIVFLGSQMGVVGGAKRAAYCGSKHAIEGIAKAMALELAPHGIRVTCLNPTFVLTPMTEKFFADPQTREWILSRIPMGRPATPEEVAASLVYLCSPAAGMVTGSHLLVDGGWTAP